ncbi:uncharacterized protein LOC128998615 [Macrosteles quadrilineatus]|uniref:uncharacterized protein LOC128998615 n=1 Tax=Macrosteles quadrilineatus TaxID=74068 RepID=UPI0023E20CC2|nr:uncharacterized protein LOC128998615 [Macrosteles quadrilineatus]
MKTSWCVCVCMCVLVLVDGKRFGFGGGGRRGGSSSSKHRIPSPPPPPPPSHTSNHGSGSSGTFLNAERSGSGTTHNRGNPFGNSAPHPPQTTGPVGFERFGTPGQQGGHQIGFDKINSPTPNRQNPYNPSAPPGPVGPPPAYPGTHSGTHFGGNDHPPAYPGRPVNAPPQYTPNGQHYPQQPFGNGFPHQTQHGSPNYGSYPGYGNSPYPGGFPAGGSNFGGGYHPNTYQGNSYGGSPFGGGGYSGNPYYSPNNFGYSNNPGYFGGGGYPGQYGYQKKSRFGGLPIPIPIPIPIPFGGFGGGYGGFGGHGHSYNHRVLDTFIKSSNTSLDNSSTSVFLLNNMTVTPCTTDHFQYDTVRVTTMACTAEACTAVKVLTRTNVSSVETMHGGTVTLCLEGENATVSSNGHLVTPTVSAVMTESITVCRNVSSNETKTANKTEEATTTTVPETTTLDLTTTTAAAVVNTTVCEKVNCSWVEMCLPAVEVVDKCTTEPCPFKRTGYKPCVVIKMCRAPSAPVSTFATLNTTISKIDEYSNHQDVYDAANLTLISYHPPVIPVFNTTTVNATSTSTPAPSS